MRGERGRKSGKRDYHVYAVLPEGQRREKERERKGDIIALFRPDASPRRGGGNKHGEGASTGGRRLR